MVQRLAIFFENDQLQIALDEHGGFGQAKLPEGGYLMSSIRRRECPVCHISHLKFTPSNLVGNEWKEIDELTFARFHQGKLHP